MSPDRHIEALMVDLIRAVEVSLAAGAAARAVVAGLLKRAAGIPTVFGNNEPGSSLTLTPQDRDFLNALSIRFEHR